MDVYSQIQVAIVKPLKEEIKKDAEAATKPTPAEGSDQAERGEPAESEKLTKDNQETVIKASFVENSEHQIDKLGSVLFEFDNNGDKYIGDFYNDIK